MVRVKVTLVFVVESDNPQEDVLYWLKGVPYELVSLRFEEEEEG